MILEYREEILLYLIFGLVFTMFYDWVLSRVDDTELHFNNFERVLMILLWPVFFTITIINLIKYIKNQ
jgi:hypothetical protein